MKVKSILFSCMIMSVPFFNYAQNTFIPDDQFEQVLVDMGVDVLPLNDSVPTAAIDTIEVLNIDFRSVSDLTGIEDFLALQEFYAFNNNIAVLDVSHNTNLKILRASYNNLDSINLSNSYELEQVLLDHCNLTEIDVSNCISLEILNLEVNHFNTLDVTNNSALKQLAVHYNNLTTLDLSSNPDLKGLNISFNDFSEIDVSENPELVSLVFRGNPLVDLDLTQNPLLRIFIGGENEFYELDVSENPALQYFLINNCENLESLNLANTNNTGIFTLELMNNPNLTCIKVDDPAYSTANWVNVDEWMSFSTSCTLGAEEEELTIVHVHALITGNELKVNALYDQLNYQFYDLKGNLIQNGALAKGEIGVRVPADLANGIYLFKVEWNQRVVTFKVVK